MFCNRNARGPPLRASARLPKICSFRHSSLRPPSKLSIIPAANAIGPIAGPRVLLRLAGAQAAPVSPAHFRIAVLVNPVSLTMPSGVQIRISAVSSRAEKAGIGDQPQLLAAAAIVAGQNADLARRTAGVRDRAMRTPRIRVTMARIQRPAHVLAVQYWHRGPSSAGGFSAAPPPHRQASWRFGIGIGALVARAGFLPRRRRTDRPSSL